MYVVPPLNPKPPSPTRADQYSSSKPSLHPHTHAPRRIPFEVARVTRTCSGTIPTSEVTSMGAMNAVHIPNSHLGIIDLTELPVPPPCSSNLSLSPSSFPSTLSLAVPKSKPRRVKSHVRMDRPLPGSQSTPTFPAPPPSLEQNPASSPRRRPTFILPSEDSDRDCDSKDAQDDSDESDRTSFFSAEEFLVPARIVRDVVNAEGKVFDERPKSGDSNRRPWQELGSAADSTTTQVDQRHHDAHHVNVHKEQEASHGLRRWHALMEIVHTEAGYVRDLRTLVNVYLALLPSLPLTALAHQAVEELSREASELLVLHERFLRALQNTSAEAADGASPISSIDEVVKQVAGLFIEEASAFDLYQRFCATQPDALRLLRPTQARAEWMAFEQRCSIGNDVAAESDASVQSRENTNSLLGETQRDVSPASTPVASAPTAMPTRTPGRTVPLRTLSLMPSAFKAYVASPPAVQATGLPASTRRHSYDSLAAVFGTPTSSSARYRSGVTSSETSVSSSTSTRASTSSSKLRFHDFLIKPVQRICKYPLMLEGLRSKIYGKGADAAVASAVKSMRAVAMRVDEARRCREAAARNKLIIERIEPHAVLKTDFITSLGDCLLAGSLDVVYHHHILEPVTTPVRVRYLGAFLYLGSYLLLVKVDKSKVYRLKHWFSLESFELVDIPQDTALVPYSFRLSYMDHHFEIATACQHEKDVWMRAIVEARSSSPPWISEPVSSLQIAQPELPAVASPADSKPLETGEPRFITTQGSSSSNLADTTNPLAVLRLSANRSRPSASNPTARMFSFTDGSSILLRRSSSSNRNFVDRGLADILSDPISSLRKQAQARDETLFPPPHFSETSQTIGITAKNRLTRRGSMLVVRPRAVFVPGTVPIDFEDDGTGQPSNFRRNNPPVPPTRMSLLPALTGLYTEPEEITDNPDTGASARKIVAPEPEASLEKLPTLSGATSLPSSPTIELRPDISHLSSFDNSGENTYSSHRRARSLVGSVRDLVRRATAKRIPTHRVTETWQTLRAPDESPSEAGESKETGSKSSIGRRRVSSTPSSPPLLSPASILFSHPNSLPQPGSIDNLVPSSAPPSLHTTSALKRLDEKPNSTPSESDHITTHRRNFKSFVFYNRLSAVDHSA